MWLAMDTATDQASVALGDHSNDAVERQLTGARRHASGLLPLIDAMLARQGATVGAIDGVLIADGPGSFTGLRVGAALAKALARAGGLPVWTAPSLMVRAAAHAAASQAGAGEVVLALSNALRGDVYAAAYRFSAGQVETILSPAVRRPESLAGTIVPDRLVGDAPPDAVRVLEERSSRQLQATDPCARYLLDLRHWRGGATPIESPSEWEPMYGRPAEAQARWESDHGRRLPDPDRGRG